MKHYLVTGGCGFIGSHLAEYLLRAGHSVTILDNLSTGERSKAPAKANVVVGDVRDAALVEKLLTTADGCFHLAAVASVQQCHDQWVEAHSTNLTGTITIFNAAARARQKPPVVFASSAAVYGNAAPPLSETLPLIPISAYGADKYGCELHARVAAEIFGVSNIGIRPFNVYGPGQSPDSMYSGVISIFARKIMAGDAITIHGDGGQSRDFIYVADACRHFVAAMEHLHRATTPLHDIFNACTGRATSVLELADTLEKVTGKRVERQFSAPRAGDVRVSVGKNEKAHSLLDVTCRTMLQDGLARTLERL